MKICLKWDLQWNLNFVRIIKEFLTLFLSSKSMLETQARNRLQEWTSHLILLLLPTIWITRLSKPKNNRFSPIIISSSLVDIFSSFFWIVDFSSNFKLHYDTFLKLFCFQHLLAWFLFYWVSHQVLKIPKIRKNSSNPNVCFDFLKWPKNFHEKNIQF